MPVEVASQKQQKGSPIQMSFGGNLMDIAKKREACAPNQEEGGEGCEANEVQLQEQEMEQLMRVFYEEYKLGEIVNPECPGCCELEKYLIEVYHNNYCLQKENKQLKKALKQMQISSYSAIQPNINEDNNMAPNNLPPESILLNEGKNQVQNDSDEMMNKIENLMTELTRLMDSLENQQNGVTKNISYQLSNTTNLNS